MQSIINYFTVREQEKAEEEFFSYSQLKRERAVH